MLESSPPKVVSMSSTSHFCVWPRISTAFNHNGSLLYGRSRCTFLSFTSSFHKPNNRLVYSIPQILLPFRKKRIVLSSLSSSNNNENQEFQKDTRNDNLGNSDQSEESSSTNNCDPDLSSSDPPRSNSSKQYLFTRVTSDSIRHQYHEKNERLAGLKEAFSKVAKTGNIQKARFMLKNLLDNGFENKTVAYTILIHAYRKAGNPRGCFQVLKEMQDLEIPANTVSCRDCVRACVETREMDCLVNIFNYFMYHKYPSDIIAWSAGMKMCFDVGSPNVAQYIFHRIVRNFSPSDLDTRLFNTMIDGFGKRNNLEEALIYFGMLCVCKGVKPNVVTYNSLLEACLRANIDHKKRFRLKSHHIMGSMKRHDVPFDIITATSLIRLSVRETSPSLTDSLERKLERSNYLSYLWRQFLTRKAFVPDRLFYNVLTDAYAQNFDYIQAERAFKAMMDDGFTPDLFSYNTLLGAYGRCEMFEKAVALFKRMRSKGIKPDQFSICSLITACGQKHRIDDVHKILRIAKSLNLARNGAILNASIGACGDDYESAVKFWQLLRREGEVTEVTCYEALLRVCGAGGRIEEGIRIVNVMKKLGFVVDSTTFSAYLRGVLDSGRGRLETREEREAFKQLQALCKVSNIRRNDIFRHARLRM